MSDLSLSDFGIEQLKRVAILAHGATGFNENDQKIMLKELDWYLANEVEDDLWEWLDGQARLALNVAKLETRQQSEVDPPTDYNNIDDKFLYILETSQDCHLSDGWCFANAYETLEAAVHYVDWTRRPKLYRIVNRTRQVVYQDVKLQKVDQVESEATK